MKNVNLLLGICLVLVILYLGKPIFVPLLYGGMISMLAYPMSSGLERRKLPRWLSVLISLTAVLAIFSLVLLLLYLVAIDVYHHLPLIMDAMKTAIPDLQDWVSETFGWNRQEQIDWLYAAVENFFREMTFIINKSLAATFTLIFNLVIIPVFAALLLYNREIYATALGHIAGSPLREKIPALLRQAIETFYRYIQGMLKVYLIVGVLNSVGLMILGIDNAWLYGMIAAFMTIIPVVGIMVSAILPMSLAWITKDSAWYALGVAGVFAVVQYLEANVIFPRVVGTQLNLNTLATLLLILIGGMLWGAGGMILFPPFMAIIQILSKDIPGWEPLKHLLSNPETKTRTGKL